MELQKFLDKVCNTSFLFTVVGLCEELSFCKYEKIKSSSKWSSYKDRQVESYAIRLTNDQPELIVFLV